MDISKKNPATETFDRIQKVVVPIILVVAAVLAIWRNGVSIALLPVALIVAALYLIVVADGARLIRSFGLKLLDRRH
jgi:cation transport ATPase